VTRDGSLARRWASRPKAKAKGRKWSTPASFLF
jgi:hypothetical protein